MPTSTEIKQLCQQTSRTKPFVHPFFVKKNGSYRQYRIQTAGGYSLVSFCTKGLHKVVGNPRMRVGQIMQLAAFKITVDPKSTLLMTRLSASRGEERFYEFSRDGVFLASVAGFSFETFLARTNHKIPRVGVAVPIRIRFRLAKIPKSQVILGQQYGWLTPP